MNSYDDYCETCGKETLWRWLDCEECKINGKDCNMVVCTVCGEGTTVGAEIYD